MKNQSFYFKGFVTQSDPWSAKDVYFLAGGLKIQLRSFDNAQNIQAEIKGKNANNGKCGHWPMQFIFKRNIKSFKFNSDKEILALQSSKGTQKVLEEILVMFKDCFGTTISDDLFYDNFVKKYKKGTTVKLLVQPEDLEHDDKSNLKLEVIDKKFRGTNFIYTLKTKNNDLIPVFVHSHHIHQHEVEEKFGVKTPIYIDHLVCF